MTSLGFIGLGRRGTLGLSLLVGGVAPFGLLAAAHNNHTVAVVGFAGLVVTASDSVVPFVVAGCLGLLGAAPTRWMRPPGHAVVRLPSVPGADRL